MKKSISIHEVPEILQELIYNTAGRNLSKHSYALPYLNKVDWTKATDAERLAYCEVRYKEDSDLIEKPAESVEFKEGEMVEHKFINSDWIADGIIFTGGRTSQGLFVCEDKHGMLRCVEQIRKIDQDADLKKIADEIRDEELGHSKGLYTWSQLAQMQTMLIEAMKRVKK